MKVRTNAVFLHRGAILKAGSYGTGDVVKATDGTKFALTDEDIERIQAASARVQATKKLEKAALGPQEEDEEDVINEGFEEEEADEDSEDEGESEDETESDEESEGTPLPRIFPARNILERQGFKTIEEVRALTPVALRKVVGAKYAGKVHEAARAK